MIRGLTTAASSMVVDERMQQALANNLANLETPGFKETLGAASEYPVQSLYEASNGQLMGQSIGKMGTGVVFQEGVPLWLEGQLKKTNRNLDVAIDDNTPIGTYGAVAAGAGGGTVSELGQVTVGANRRLEINGRPLAVVNSSGQAVPGWYAVKNPSYQGQALYGADGRPDYDAKGNPSYLFENAKGQVMANPSDVSAAAWSLRIGTNADMGPHSFYAVAYQSNQGPHGIALTQDGHFSVAQNHELVDAAGHALLPVGANGQVLPGGRIVINANYTGTALFAPDGGPVYDSAGQPSYRVLGANGQPIAGARLGTVNVDVTQVTPLGATEYQVDNSFNPTVVLPKLSAGTGTLKPGYLEESNVNATQMMAQMLQVVNQYQANELMLQQINTTLGLAVQDVGKV
ncbi:MAG: flagellar basal body rod protein [Alicyclobacillaceae bacterium]|uniref:flagellar basal body rod C-terminal domain-containing protein n=1 Tax=Alicyclobacillus sp. SP_1 TaxID=2942475 RepID=UPI00215740D4|nr:flagellar basal body rod C-terminal domain-containing protein [Alicyclobacillus sp. SP_1]MCY0888011.1 flagellar basal body rod protein [Alicyclobacillaceae bacterium]